MAHMGHIMGWTGRGRTEEVKQAGFLPVRHEEGRNGTRCGTGQAEGMYRHDEVVVEEESLERLHLPDRLWPPRDLVRSQPQHPAR